MERASMNGNASLRQNFGAEASFAPCIAAAAVPLIRAPPHAYVDFAGTKPLYARRQRLGEQAQSRDINGTALRRAPHGELLRAYIDIAEIFCGQRLHRAIGL